MGIHHLGREARAARNRSRPERFRYVHVVPQDTAIAIPDDIESVWLRTKVRTRTYTYEYSFDGKTWHEIPVTLDAAVLSDDHVAQRYGGFFTGAFVGLVAVDLSGYGKEAIFSHFDYMEI